MKFNSITAIIQPPMKPANIHIATPAQRRALISPLRIEILERLKALGEASIAQVSHALGRPCDALYFHFRTLQRVGLLIRSPGKRGVIGAGARFQLVAPSIAIAADRQSPSSAGDAARAIGAMLRLAHRDAAVALRGGYARPDGPTANFTVARRRCTLSDESLRKLNDLIAEVRNLLEANPPTEETTSPRANCCTVLVMVTPCPPRGCSKPRRKAATPKERRNADGR